jgi:hypothetical protein
MSQTAPIQASLEEHDNVVLQDLTDWDGTTTEGMDQVEHDWERVASQPHITASVTEFDSDLSLGRETQNHLAREWTANAEAVGIEKIAFVSEGIKARAVSANLDVEQDVQTFSSVSNAVEWARE